MKGRCVVRVHVEVEVEGRCGECACGGGGEREVCGECVCVGGVW